MSLRMQKVNQEIKRQITYIIQQELDDPEIEFISITRVDTCSDLSESKIYFSMLNENKYEVAQDILNKSNKFIRTALAKRIYLKTLPNLKFIPDASIKYSVEMYQKIEEIMEEDRNKRGGNDV